MQKWIVLANNGYRYEYFGEVYADDWRVARKVALYKYLNDWRLKDFKVTRA